MWSERNIALHGSSNLLVCLPAMTVEVMRLSRGSHLPKLHGSSLLGSIRGESVPAGRSFGMLIQDTVLEVQVLFLVFLKLLPASKSPTYLYSQIELALQLLCPRPHMACVFLEHKVSYCHIQPLF